MNSKPDVSNQSVPPSLIDQANLTITTLLDQLKAANYWRERWCNDYHALAAQRDRPFEVLCNSLDKSEKLEVLLEDLVAACMSSHSVLYQTLSRVNDELEKLRKNEAVAVRRDP